MDKFSLLNRIVTKRFLLHALFWLVNLIVINTIVYFVPEVDFWNYFNRLLIVITLVIGCSYIHLLVLIPKFFVAKKYGKYVLGFLINISFFSFLKIFIKLSILKDPIDNNYLEEISTAVTLMLFYCLFTFSMKTIKEWVTVQDITIRLRETEKQKLEAELTALKAQINPHFMFNTLNNIYSLSLDKSDKTPALILKLADLMSYTLYECSEDRVNISKEIDFIKNYIELEKIRLKNGIKIHFDIAGNYENCRVAPLLFIPFIENAFKHGVNQRPQHPYIDIVFDFSKKRTVCFSIENSKPTTPEIRSNNKGIGIENVRKRLNLLYENRFNLELIESPEKYKVVLEIAVS